MGQGVGQTHRPRAYYYNKKTNKISQRVVSRTNVGPNSDFDGPHDSKEQAAIAALKYRPDRKSRFARQPRAPKKNGEPVKTHENDYWVRAGDAYANGERHYIVVGSKKYNDLLKYGVLIDGVSVDQLPKLSNAQKLQQTKANSSAARPTSGKSKEQLYDEKVARLARAREANKGVTYTRCVVNPDSKGIVGIANSKTGKVTRGAREVARALGLDSAASLHNGEYRVSDREVIAFLERQIETGKLKEKKNAAKCRPH
jgi:hypothetical protein